MDKTFTKVPNQNKKSDFNVQQTLQNIEKETEPFLKKVWLKLKNLVRLIAQGLQKLWQQFLRSFAAWVDPKLEPYREYHKTKFDNAKKSKNSGEVVVAEEVYAPIVPEAPQNRDELLDLIRQAPMTVLTSQERKAISAILSLSDVSVSEIMTPATKIIFVNQDETLGPLILDRLYRSGFTFFPVIDGRQHIIGTLHTAMLNSLDVKDTNSADKVMDPRVYYIRSDYSLEDALKAFLRTDSQLMLVVDRYEKLAGMLTFSQVLGFLFDEKFQDDFDRDNDRIAVAKRKITK